MKLTLRELYLLRKEYKPHVFFECRKGQWYTISGNSVKTITLEELKELL